MPPADENSVEGPEESVGRTTVGVGDGVVTGVEIGTRGVRLEGERASRERLCSRDLLDVGGSEGAGHEAERPGHEKAYERRSEDRRRGVRRILATPVELGQ